MSELGRYVSKETQKKLEEAERKNPEGLAVAIESDPNEEVHEDFEEVKKTDITSKVVDVSLSDIFGESLIKSKEEKKMEEIKQNKEIEKKNKFESFIVWADKVFKIQDGKYYSITLRSTANGEKLGRKLTILLRGNRLCKKQPSRPDLMSFWVYGDEKFKVQEHVKNVETGEYQYLDAGTIDTQTLLLMLQTPNK